MRIARRAAFASAIAPAVRRRPKAIGKGKQLDGDDGVVGWRT